MTDLAAPQQDVAGLLDQYRSELNGYCYRMLGSAFESEDAVQETMVRAWRAYDRFEGRSQLRSWLYRIATNVCMDALNGRERRARPMDLGPSTDAPDVSHLGPQLGEATWILPVPDAHVVPGDADPAEVAQARETLRLAFIGALQHLPPLQRAALILREVLRWQATEVAALLDTTVPAVNSALQRARATLEQSNLTPEALADPADADQRALADRYLQAFESYDMDALTALLHEDATLSMPPYALWMRGHDDIVGWMLGAGSDCKGSKMIPTVANGSPAFGQYRCIDGEYHPWGLHVIEMRDGQITGINVFLDTPALFPLFGLPTAPS